VRKHKVISKTVNVSRNVLKIRAKHNHI